MANDDWVVIDHDGAEGVARVLQRYPDGDVRVSFQGRTIVVPAGSWTECEE